jgi:4-hydroxythreonine-4-phosphate dehydrogenase
MSGNEKIIVGISVGDLNGIGGEIILKTFADSRMMELCTPVVFASAKLLSFYRKLLDLETPLHGVDSLEALNPKKLNVLNVWRDRVEVNFGEEQKEAGAYALQSLRAAVKALKGSEIDVLVTAPINKSNIQAETFSFPGHTDYLAEELDGESLMLMVSDDLRVGLLTDHIPVREVSATITPQLIDKKVNLVNDALIQDFGIERPRIAVLGINPHIGDQGVIGSEDDQVMIPTLAAIREKGILAYGPYAADSFFGSGNYKNFDAILASYHDQGLIPFKTLAFGKGVNFTAGLSRVRTSPDHGTAYEIAGKNQADHRSFRQAVYTAIEIYRRRKQYQELSQNPLKPARRKPLGKKK